MTAEHGYVDVVVTTPGINIRKPITAYEDADFDRVIEVNLKGTFRVLREAGRIMESGALVPDEVMVGLIAERLRQPDAARGFILDGFPRTIAQAEALNHLLKDLGQALDAVVYFDVAEPELLRRLTGRRLCRQCQTAFHLVSAPPQRAGICDRCGGELYQRDDDSEATVRHRLDVYARQTAPLLDYYRGRGLLSSVKGEGSVPSIAAAIRRAATEAR